MSIKRFVRAVTRGKTSSALRGLNEDTVWDHLAGAVSAPFEADDHGQVAVKVIDDRGNELMVVRNLKQ
jgi:adenine-specific DNA-methyltransferase